MPLETGQAQPAQAAWPGEPARCCIHLRRSQLLSGADCLVDGGLDHVLEKLDVLGVQAEVADEVTDLARHALRPDDDPPVRAVAAVLGGVRRELMNGESKALRELRIEAETGRIWQEGCGDFEEVEPSVTPDPSAEPTAPEGGAGWV